MNRVYLWGLCLALAGILGCSAVPPPRTALDTGPSVYEDPASPGALVTLGFGSQDIISLTDQMMRDILAHTFWRRRGSPPRVIIDRNCFTNQGSGYLNLRLITDRLRVELNRAARGRMIFVSPYLYEFQLHKDDPFGRQMASRGLYPHGAAYRLCGNITTIDIRSPNGMMLSRYTQVALEMVERKSARVVWGKVFSFRKAAARADLDPTSARSLSNRPGPPPWRGANNSDPWESILVW